MEPSMREDAEDLAVDHVCTWGGSALNGLQKRQCVFNIGSVFLSVFHLWARTLWKTMPLRLYPPSSG